MERIWRFCKINVCISCKIWESKRVINCFGLNNRSLYNRIIWKRPNTVICRHSIIRKLEPCLRSLCLGKDNIVISLKIVGYKVCLSWIDDRVDVINWKIKVWRCLEQKINILLRDTRAILTRKIAARHYSNLCDVTFWWCNTSSYGKFLSDLRT